ncbi:MAG: hypothetical protein KF846_00050 [Cyclobacteriaceae bacterium]|nr:hypothetical protein [Cyclobacteriaceae bacterium]
MKSMLTIILFLTISVQSFPQDYQEPKVIPPSPDAGNLGKYGDYPISYNTGTPNIDIPLYELNVHDIKVPVSLSYHASGFQVDEIASWVGLGFALNAGGVITRTMRGLPDEAPNGYFNYVNWDTLNYWMWNIPPGEPHPVTITKAADYRHYFLLNASAGEFDFQPDIFSFNFLGYSGKIIFQVDKTPVIYPYQDFLITTPFDENGNPQQWTITTPDGLIFTFSEGEYTTPLNVGTGQINFFSAWYLSTISSLKSPGYVNFNYNTLQLMGIENSNNSGVVLSKVGPPPADPCLMDPPYGVGTSSNEYAISVKYLSSISWAQGIVEFFTSNREDRYNSVTYNGKKLDQIRVRSNPYTPLNIVVKTINFSYDYFGTNERKRLKLTSVRDGENEPFSFEYNALVLPPVTDLSRDHWGYFNGSNNTSLIPALTDTEKNYWHNQPAASANRKANSNTIASLLNKIIYPTKGYTEFNFEPHTVFGELEAERIYQISATGAQQNQNMNSHESGLLNYYVTQQIAFFGGPINIKSTAFTLTENKDVLLSYTASNAGGGEIGSISESLLFKLPITNYATPICQSFNGLKYLTSGDYVLITAASQSGVTVTARVTEPYTYEDNYVVGGARIASLVNFDGANTYTKNFNYNLPNGRSSAVLFNMPVYKKITPCGHLYVSAYNVNPYNDGGSHIGYAQVRVTDEGGSNGSKLYNYLNGAVLLRNQLRDEITFNSNGDTLHHVRKEYDSDSFFSYAKGVVVKKALHHLSLYPKGGPDDNGEPGYYKDYWDFDILEDTYSTYFVYPKKVTEKIFSTTNYPAFLKTVNETQIGTEGPTYYSRHLLPNLNKFTHSNGDVFVNKIINSPDANEPNLAEIKVPIFQHSLKEINGTQYLLNSIKTSFTQNNPSQIYLYQPLSLVTYTNELNIPYEHRYTNIYINKVLRERFKINGTPVSYIWDNERINPIAEVTNSSYGTIAYTSFEASSNEGGWSFTINSINGGKTGDRCHAFSGGSISNTLSSIVQYRISFWMKNGSPTVSNALAASINPVYTDGSGWKLYEYNTNTNATLVSISAPAGTLIDELRLHPREALMTTYTYQIGVGVSSITDANNQSSYFTYDGNNRLKLIKDPKQNIVKHYQYNFKN